MASAFTLTGFAAGSYLLSAESAGGMAAYRGSYPSNTEARAVPFNGPAIGMITAGMLSLAFMGFAGLV